jgi:hypothetical protein
VKLKLNEEYLYYEHIWCIGVMCNMEDDRSITSIRVRRNTLNRLKALGAKDEAYDDIITWLLDHAPKKRKR